MDALFIGLAVFVGLFGMVLLSGAPYVPSMRKQINAGLDLLDLKRGQTMLELGCGDGRVLRAAAKRGWNAVGYEINPLLVLAAKLQTWRYRRQVRVVWANYWRSKWPEAQGIYVFLLDPYMGKLDKKIIQELAVSPKLAFERSSIRRVGFLRRALLRLPLLNRSSISTSHSAARPRLARHQNAATPKGIKVVSFAFKIPGKKWEKHQNGVFLYNYR